MQKITQFFKSTLIFLFAAFLVFNLGIGTAMATGNFSQSCDSINVDGSNLSAICKTRDQTPKQAELNLDSYIGNLDGQLSWGDHNFSQTCENIALGNDFRTRELLLSAECKKRNGEEIYSYIPLDEHIANIDGILEYE